MTNPQIAHLVIVGIVFLAITAALGYGLRKASPRWWWLWLSIIVLGPIVFPLLISLLSHSAA